LLEERAIPAIAFAVTHHLGGTNDWDAKLGAPQLPLASAGDLRSLPRRGIAIGSHTRSHRMLNRLPAAEVDEELEGSRRDLQTAEIPAIPMLAYPHGEHDGEVQRAAKKAGYAAAFTVEAGLVRDGVNRYALPRLEIFRSDRGLRLWWKILKGGHGERS
jgi:peptidoglycan/xylan/chitin deacetylase (PgdA/CDA1 family)